MSDKSNNEISLVVADDHVMVRTGLLLSLELELGIRNVLEAASCAEVMSVLRAYNPTHMIIDMVFRDGNAMEILPSIVKLYPNLQILVYSMMPAEVYLPSLQKYGINCYLNKEAGTSATLAMFREFLINKLAHTQAQGTIVNPFSRLSARELEVLHYLLKGEPVTTIAQALNLHKNTVSTLKNRILDKTGVRNMKELSDAASLQGLSY